MAKTKLGTDSPIIPVTLIGIGGYLAWFGVKYWRSTVRWPSDPIKAVLSGQPIPPAKADTSTEDAIKANLAALTAPPSAAVFPNPSAPGAGVAIAGYPIAEAAKRYAGQGYVFGGPADRPGDWDCSSFVSYVLGHDLGQALPGGGHYGDPGYPPHTHGPTTVQYMLFGTGINLGDVRAGDLIVSIEHIGIAISPTQMISAQDPADGTRISDFPAGFPSGPPIYRRVASS